MGVYLVHHAMAPHLIISIANVTCTHPLPFVIKNENVSIILHYRFFKMHLRIFRWLVFFSIINYYLWEFICLTRRNNVLLCASFDNQRDRYYVQTQTQTQNHFIWPIMLYSDIFYSVLILWYFGQEIPTKTIESLV